MGCLTHKLVFEEMQLDSLDNWQFSIGKVIQGNHKEQMSVVYSVWNQSNSNENHNLETAITPQ